MDDKTLVERLRNLAEEWFEMCDDIHEPLFEAATRIEVLEAVLRDIMNDECLDPWSKAKQALESQP